MYFRSFSLSLEYWSKVACYSVISSCFNQSWHRRKTKWMGKKVYWTLCCRWIRAGIEFPDSCCKLLLKHTHAQTMPSTALLYRSSPYIFFCADSTNKALWKTQFTKSFGILAFNLMPRVYATKFEKFATMWWILIHTFPLFRPHWLGPCKWCTKRLCIMPTVERQIYEKLRVKWTNACVMVMAPLECFAGEFALHSILFTYHLHLSCYCFHLAFTFNAVATDTELHCNSAQHVDSCLNPMCICHRMRRVSGILFEKSLGLLVLLSVWLKPHRHTHISHSMCSLLDRMQSLLHAFLIYATLHFLHLCVGTAFDC